MLNKAIAKWWLTLPEETKTPLQKQIEVVKKTVDRSPIIVLVLSILSMLSIGLTALFAEPNFGIVWYIGTTIAITSTAFSTYWVRAAKEQYSDLVEQLASKS